MADALFTADDLSPENCARLAHKLGLDLKRYKQLLADPDTEKQLDENSWVLSAQVPGLPAVWIGKVRLTGLQATQTLRRALESAR